MMNDLQKHSVAKALRKNLTDTERLLWRHLRAKQIEGYKFRRQEPVGTYRRFCMSGGKDNH